MKFKDKVTGTIHNVTNESLIPQYEADERFAKVTEEVKAVKEEKATTAKKNTKK